MKKKQTMLAATVAATLAAAGAAHAGTIDLSGATITGSSFYDQGSETFPLSNLIDGELNDTGVPGDWSMWLGDNAELSWFTIELASPQWMSGIEVQNTHNRGYNDRATLGFNLLASMDGTNFDTILSNQPLALDFGDPIAFESFTTAAFQAKYVKFEVTDYYYQGAGLNEIRLLEGRDPNPPTGPTAVPLPAATWMGLPLLGLVAGAKALRQRKLAK